MFLIGPLPDLSNTTSNFDWQAYFSLVDGRFSFSAPDQAHDWSMLLTCLSTVPIPLLTHRAWAWIVEENKEQVAA